MSKEDVIELEGKVVEVLPNANFKVDIGKGNIILAYISGKLRTNYIRILQGDTVTVEISPYDLTRGRITWRSKENKENKENIEKDVTLDKKGGENSES